MIKNDAFLCYWLPVILWLGFIFLLSSIPGPMFPPLSDTWMFWGHRVAHFGEYSILGVLLMRAYSHGKGGIGVGTILLLALLILVAGLFDEWHQSFVPGRHPDLLDAAFDTICGTFGMLMYKMCFRRV